MESASLAQSATGIQVEDKGLKKNAISFLSNIVIGVASTAPAYSLAATLGGVAAFVGVFSPSIMVLAFIPMIMIAASYYWMNRADPDCGTTFSWVTRAMGPRLGWMGGWGILVTDIIVMPSLSQIAGQYTFSLFGNNNPTTAEVTVVGVVWIVVMTAICYIGIELSARTQQLLLGAEFTILVLFSVVALVKVYTGNALRTSMRPSLHWFNPFAIHGFNNFTEAILLAVFIYWGWDSGVTVNEETEDSGTAPGRAAIVSNLVLVGIFVVVAVAATAYAGPALLAANQNDVFAAMGHSALGSGVDKLLIIAVLTSASASTQTTILPTARTVLSMARAEAIPKVFGNIHPRYLSPSVATLAMGGFSTAWYVVMTIISPNVLGDSILALGLGIAFYYGITGFACAIFYRRQLRSSARNFFFIGVLPVVGGIILFALFVKSCFDLVKTSSGSTVIFGLGGPFVIGLGSLLLGIPFMFLCQWRLPGGFFKRRPEVADPALVASSPAGRHS
ncbi:MAG: APC family permease [Solirubrobacteraceae bacterium]